MNANETYPRWAWADRDALRVETAPDLFVDYMRANGVWRQKTRPMTASESVTPERHWIGDWRYRPGCWPEVDAELAEWLENTLNAHPPLGGTR